MFQLVRLSILALIFAFALMLNAESTVAAKPKVDIILDQASADKVKAEKKTTLNFEDELIEGSAQKPDLFYLFQKDNFKFKKLIKLRENFIPEMVRNAEDIQRLRGGR